MAKKNNLQGEKHELQKFNNFVLFTAGNGKVNIDVYFHDETLWLTQKAIAELFEKGRTTITEHLKKIFNEGELDEDSVCRDFRRTAEDEINKSMKKFKDKIKKALSSIFLDIARLRNRLRKQYITTALASEKYLTFRCLDFHRLRIRLRIDQLNQFSSLQIRTSLRFANKDKTTVNHIIKPIFFAAFFAKRST